MPEEPWSTEMRKKKKLNGAEENFLWPDGRLFGNFTLKNNSNRRWSTYYIAIVELYLLNIFVSLSLNKQISDLVHLYFWNFSKSCQPDLQKKWESRTKVGSFENFRHPDKKKPKKTNLTAAQFSNPARMGTSALGALCCNPAILGGQG